MTRNRLVLHLVYQILNHTPMRKYCYQATMKILPAYFVVLAVGIVLAFVFMPKAHAQTNSISLYERNEEINSNVFPVATSSTILLMDKIVDDEKDELTLSLNPAHDHVNISVTKEITNIVVYDLSNNVVEDVIIDIPTKQIDFSSSCPGVYYIRVDYKGGSHLKRMVIQ
jgi:hypothetical protein